MIVRSPSLASLLAACCAVMLCLASAPNARAQDPSTDSPALKQLLKERLAILTMIYESQAEGHKQGVISFDKVQEAQLAMLEAKLELCDTKEERLKVHEEIVDAAKKSVQVAEELYKSAQAPQSEWLAAKVRVLDAQIRLERAKAGR